MASLRGALFCECSAKTNEGISDAMNSVIAEVCRF